MTIMFDSVTPGDIPADAEMVAGYASGTYAGSRYWGAPGAWERFATRRKVRIATSAAHTGLDIDALDVENGDATPDQAPGWIIRQRALGYFRPTIYCEVSARGAVENACAHAGFALGQHYDLWVAHYRSSAAKAPWCEAGAVATQFANASTSGGHFDLSLVVDPEWPRRSAQPQPHPPEPIPTTEDDDMPRIRIPVDANGNDHDASGNPIGPELYFVDGWWTEITNERERDELVAAGAVVSHASPFVIELETTRTPHKPR